MKTKLKFTAALYWPHEGGLLYFEKDQVIETENELLITVCLEQGWAITPPEDVPKWRATTE